MFNESGYIESHGSDEMMERSGTTKTWSKTLNDYNYIIALGKLKFNNKNVSIGSYDYNEIISVIIIDIFKYIYCIIIKCDSINILRSNINNKMALNGFIPNKIILNVGILFLC